MINFLHTYTPNNILLSLGLINVYWYGLFVVFGMLFGIFVILKLASRYDISKDMLVDLIFWMIVGGIFGARIYDILLNLNYYWQRPIEALKIWQGGLAIHGAIIGAILILFFFAKKYRQNFWFLAALLAPGAILGQAIGRFGNYFNQELFGKPTSLPWGIPIESIHRPIEYFDRAFFHPVFLYESIGNLAIFIILISMHLILPRNRIYSSKIIVAAYLILYSILRFTLEYLRTDPVPAVIGLRLPQAVSIALILVGLLIIFSYRFPKNAKQKSALDE